ncbi:MAG: glycosyltransferase family 2 protein [Muribaculaceae bacterium]|nr:glycosyltransferase family 2 protein [Muribaculaceae bacterium]
MVRLGIVSPCYNEEGVLSISAGKLANILTDLGEKGKISSDSFVLFVNDGSKDSTWNIIKSLHNEDSRFKGLNLARNVGHQNAIMAGMMTAKDWADVVVTIDADIQDDIYAIEKMIDEYEDGADVVYGIKVSRKADPFLKRMSALAFYNLQKKMGVNCVYNHADFRLMSNRALNMLAEYPEKNLYLRALITNIGLPSATVEDVIVEREAGQSKYTLSKMLNLAVDGITSFSIKPIYLIFYIGLIFLAISIFILGNVIYSKLTGSAISGWASQILSIWFVGGALMVGIATVGIYIGKIYTEVKARPLYHIQEILK